MRLVHYSDAPLREVRRPDQTGDQCPWWFKPRGLWVSDDDCERNWRQWCESERFRLDALTHPHEVELTADAKVLVLGSAADIDAFTRAWAIHPHPAIKTNLWINWPAVQQRWDGIICTPYIWERRLTYGENDAMWYYSWDCASGCIWEPKAIASIRLRDGPRTIAPRGPRVVR